MSMLYKKIVKLSAIESIVAYNDIVLGINRSEYLEWAVSNGYSLKGAKSCWSKTHSLVTDERRGNIEIKIIRKKVA